MHFASLNNHRKNDNPISKTNDTQDCHKFELHGSPTTKDLKKPHSSRWVGRAESWRRGREVVRHREVTIAVVVEQMVPHSHVVDKN